MNIETYVEKPRSVDAAQVTDENIADIVEWVTGDRKFSTGEYSEKLGHTYIFEVPGDTHHDRHPIRVQAGTYIVNERGSFYPLPADYFHERWTRP